MQMQRFSKSDFESEIQISMALLSTAAEALNSEIHLKNGIEFDKRKLRRRCP